ncbi:MAG: methylated-DNA--[protein]-cysteine S-methyltransferase [Armatimonadota bacterium]
MTGSASTERQVGSVLRCRVGWMPAVRSKRGVVSLELPTADRRAAAASLRRVRVVGPDEDDLLAQLAAELAGYFNGERVDFSVPVDLRGVSRFRRRVLLTAARIPYGEVVTYGDVARAVGHPRGARAVGQAMGANPVPIVVPCHRVIASTGGLGGFGAGLAWKAALLTLEREGRLISSPPDERSARTGHRTWD